MLKQGNNEMREDQNPQQGGTGENTPFAEQSRKKERDNGNNKGCSWWPLTPLATL